jgi:hypothetical protein
MAGLINVGALNETGERKDFLERSVDRYNIIS